MAATNVSIASPDPGRRVARAPAGSRFSDGRVVVASSNGRRVMAASGAALCEQAGNVALLEVNPDLAGDLASDEVQLALGALVVPAVRVQGGQWDSWGVRE